MHSRIWENNFLFSNNYIGVFGPQVMWVDHWYWNNNMPPPLPRLAYQIEIDVIHVMDD